MVYVDGLEVVRVPALAPDYDNSPVTVGADIDEGEVQIPFRGMLDDIRLYARALTADEIGELANPD